MGSLAVTSRAWTAQAGRIAFTLALTTAATVIAPARAQEPAGHTRSDIEWLQAIQNAAQKTNYSGTIYYQQGAEVRVSRIVHQFASGVSRERLQMLDGERREYVRKADEVQCLIPDTKRVILEKRPVGGNFPALSSAAPTDILRYYSLRRGSVERVADVECQVIVLEPKDKARYGYRLWVERNTGLLLRAQMLGESQDVIEQMAFTEVRLGEAADPSRMKPSWSTDGWQVEKPDYKKVDIARDWSLVLPDGFRQLSSVMRRFTHNGGREALQAVYSDGLATLSIFIQSDHGGAVLGVAKNRGPINAYVNRLGDTMVTVVGEVPPATVRDVALSVKAREAR